MLFWKCPKCEHILGDGLLEESDWSQNDHVWVDFMKGFIVLLFMPQLIQKILDFKSWVLGYLKIDLDDPKVLVGHIDMH